jgi:hypothetical protein
MIHDATHLEDLGDRFIIKCPTCSERSGPYSPEMSFAERYCSCGTVFAIDVDAERPGEIYSE